MPHGIEIACSSCNLFLLQLNHGIFIPEFHKIYSNTSIVCTCKISKVSCARNASWNGHQEQGSLISVENRVRRSITAPNFSRNILWKLCDRKPWKIYMYILEICWNISREIPKQKYLDTVACKRNRFQLLLAISIPQGMIVRDSVSFFIYQNYLR